MAKNKKFVLVFLFVFFLGLFLRIISSTLINKGDVVVQLEWSKVIYKEGLRNSFFYPIWTYSPPTQPPLMMLSFWLSRHIYENRYLLSEMHNLIKIPPACLIIWFDKFGEFFLIRLWATIADIGISFLIYFLVFSFTKKKWFSLFAFSFVFLNPILLFETGVWGQNDIFSALFFYLAFFVLKKTSFRFFTSPVFFLIGFLIKPVGLVLLPFYLFYYFFVYFKSQGSFLNKIGKLILVFFVSCSIIYLSFFPFIKIDHNHFKEIENIISLRIAPSSKGVSKASISAFNFYSLFFKIDYSLGSQKILGLSLDNLGKIFFILINLFCAWFFIDKNKNNQGKHKIGILAFILFLISQGSFLFLTSMLERYFLIGFIASNILLFLYFSKIGINMIIQQIIWLINLLYAFFLRDLSFIKTIFWDYNYLGIRLISLVSLINFFIIFVRMKSNFDD